MTAAPVDTITILTTKGPLATKRIIAVQGGPPKIEPYGNPKWFSFDEMPVASFDDMVAALEALQHRSRSLLVRGKPADSIDRENAPRRSRPRAGEPATLLVQPRFWLPLDLDSVPCPAGIDLIWEPDAVVEHVVELLPEEFHGVSVFWAFTSGHAIKPGIRIRLFYWLDRALADWEVKAWLAGPIAEKLIDGALYSPAQPIYVAQPVFVGMPDPVPHRFGTWTGHSDAVTPPVVERPQRGSSTAAGANQGDGGGYTAYRARIGDGVLRNGFYGPLKGAIGAFVGEAGVNADTAWLREDLEKAIREAPRDPASHDDSYVEDRVADLDRWIAWTLDREKETAAAAAEPWEPTYPAPLGSVAEARRVLAETMRDIVDQVRGYHATRQQQATEPTAEGELDLNPEDSEEPPPLAWAISVDVGLGKTRTFREIVVPELVRDGLSVVLAVPRHKLGDEVVADLIPAGIAARVYRGRDADDPDAPGEKMCREHERAAAIFAAMGDIERHACRNKRAKTVCPSYEVCGYQKQKLAMPQVWLIPHELLFHLQAAFIPAAAVVGVDESFWGAALQGTEVPITVAANDLTGDRTVPGGSVLDSADLTETSRRVLEAITGHKDGFIRRDALIRAGVTADNLRNAQKLEWRRKLPLDGVQPGMPRRGAIMLCDKVAARNKMVRRIARLFDLLARQIEGELDLSPWVERTQEKGAPCLRMAWRRDIHQSWSAPTVVMDATLQPEIVRQFFPQVGEPVRVSARMPHTYVRQIVDRPMSAAMLLETDTASDRRNQSRRNNVERVRRFIEVRAAEVWPRKGLVICQEGLEKALKAGALPSNVEIAHFNAITGLNSWSDVAALIVIGRTEPSPPSVEHISRALFGSVPVEVAPDGEGNVSYPRVARGIRMRDGSGRRVEGSQHPDPQVEAVRWAICEAELIQAIGRGRGVNRTAANPLQIDILTNVVLPIAVDEITTWAAIQPSASDMMAARGAVPGSYADMAAAYPDLFSSAEAARQRGGENPGKTSIGNTNRRFTRVSSQAFYRRHGSRGPAARLLYDPRRIDPAAWLAERLGPVTILNTAEPVTLAQPANNLHVEPVATEAEPGEPETALATGSEPAADGELDAPDILDPTPVADDGPAVARRCCGWFVLREDGTQRHCGEPIPNGLEWCHEHRRQYARTLAPTAIARDWLPPIESASQEEALAPPADQAAVVVRLSAPIPPEWAQHVARLPGLRPPTEIQPVRWQQLAKASRYLLVDGWGAEAVALGWSALDLFGVDPSAPEHCRDAMGLAALLRDCAVVALDPDGADLRTSGGAHQRFSRRAMPPGTVLLWNLGKSAVGHIAA